MQQTDKFATKQTDKFATKQKDEWDQLPEHKWIVNLECYIQNLKRKLGDCYPQKHSEKYELGEEIYERNLLLKKYMQRITPCGRGIECLVIDCPFYHTKKDRSTIQQNKENKDDDLFYKKRFFSLLDEILPFLMNDLASLVFRFGSKAESSRLDCEGVFKHEPLIKADLSFPATK